MTTYLNHHEYLKDQLSSFRRAKKILKNYKENMENDCVFDGIDYRGDYDKVIEAMNEAQKFLNQEQKKISVELKNTRAN